MKAAAENAVAADIDAIFGGHRRIGYADIGYHFVVDYNGRVWEARSLAYAGAHVAGHNDDNIGILALGNFNRQAPSTAMVSTIRKVVETLQQHYSIKAERVYGHRELGSSDCPGNNLFKRVTEMRSAWIAKNKTLEKQAGA
jgi:N-acetyl-anhydromuramyl-L-alanine amidase AmpD